MSATPRLFVNANLRRNAYAALDEQQSKYLTRVLRLDVGAHVFVRGHSLLQHRVATGKFSARRLGQDDHSRCD